MTRGRCPKCAERIRTEALVCRYCGSDLTEHVSEDTQSKFRIATFVTAGVLALIGSGAVAFWSFRSPALHQSNESTLTGTPFEARDTFRSLSPQFPLLQIGESIEWNGTSAPSLKRQAGPYVLDVARRTEGDLVVPIVKISAGGQQISLEGEPGSETSPSQITVLSNRAGAVPVIMLQSFTGGAHCCNHLQLAGFSVGKLKTVDLGQWDGDFIPTPKDISGDGVADFVMRDNGFLYAFAPYAQSYAPPKVLNVVGGKVIDVSRRPEFRSIFLKEMETSGADCQPGGGLTANGACPSFVAAAARVGKLDQAWSQMIGAYDASVDWKLPTGCWSANVDECPAGQEIIYKSYPEALQAFLVSTGYISKSWVPPEQRQQPSKAPPPIPWTT